VTNFSNLNKVKKETFEGKGKEKGKGRKMKILFL
jgi:hypothetical protein